MGLFKSKEEKAAQKATEEKAQEKANKLKSLKSKLDQLSQHIPVISLQNPHNWNYRAIDMVASRSTMGTGFWGEGSSWVTDILGTEDASQNKKILKGEGLCINRLKEQCATLGANAVIGVDIDYSEIGGGTESVLGSNGAKALVCMAGTAILLENPEDVLPKKDAEMLSKIDAVLQEIEEVKAN